MTQALTVTVPTAGPIFAQPTGPSWVEMFASSERDVFLEPRAVSILWAQIDSNQQQKESDLKNFLLLHYGFEKPTPEIMGAWGDWFESIADKMVDSGHLPGGREISRAGTKELPMAKDSITGYTVVRAQNLDEAQGIAEGCPIIASTRVYEIMSK